MPPTKKRILVVDNEPASTRMVRLTLEKAAFDVREVNDPSAALHVARLFRPDLVLLDVEMPGMDGGEVARGLQAEEAFRKLPIIFMTSLVTEEETAKNPMTTNGLRVLAKPVTMAKLVQCVVERLNILVVDTGTGGAAPAGGR